MTRMIHVGVLLAVLTTGAVGASVRPPRPASASRTPVLVELFTSEGCSSCPPADALLRHLIADQPVDGVEIVGLGNHVDYWDRLGWRDPFSAALFSQRQSSYDADVFRSGSVYTPQIVVDGFLESVGSDEAAVRRNILSAARQPKVSLTPAVTQLTDASLRLDVRVVVPAQFGRKSAADVVVAITEDGLTTQVERGENGGRALAHSGVVRLLQTIGRVGATEQTASVAAVVKLEKDWNPNHLRLVTFVQEQTSRRILGTVAVMLRPAVPAEPQ